jgi:hypothetical protein
MRGLLGASVLLAACAKPPAARPAPRRDPPPPVLVVTLDHVALRTAAWVELHALLATAARTSQELGDAELDEAARAYGEALRGDERDERLAASIHAVSACPDERCAREALAGTPFGPPFAQALQGFLARRWNDRAGTARTGVEAARGAMGAETDVLVERLARDLGVTWPEAPVVVDVVADAPPPGREAPVRALLAARGTCFVPPKGEKLDDVLLEVLGAGQAPKVDAAAEPIRVHDARIIDCVLAYAGIGLAKESKLHEALVAELGERDGSRAFTLVAVHASAALVMAWEARHVSPLRRSAAAVETNAMRWLGSNWAARMRGEDVTTFAKRYAAAFREKR